MHIAVKRSGSRNQEKRTVDVCVQTAARGPETVRMSDAVRIQEFSVSGLLGYAPILGKAVTRERGGS